MRTLPATDLRKNLLTLAVPADRLPFVGARMRALFPAEEYDPNFRGQHLHTTYFDTSAWTLRRARQKKKQYLTVRLRGYSPIPGPDDKQPEGAYALSLKTESGKYRVAIPNGMAEEYLRKGILEVDALPPLPADLVSRYLALVDDQSLQPVVCVSFTRYAVESSTDRLTLDTEILTSNGKRFPTNVLEVKTTSKPYEPLPEVITWGLSPLRLSKFLWATDF